QVEESPGGEVVLPSVNRDLSHVTDRARRAGSVAQRGVGTAPHANRRRNPVDDLIVPLVEDGDSPITRWNPRQGKCSIFIALCEPDISAIRAADAGEALGVTKGLARPRAVQPLIRPSAHVYAGDHSGHEL